MRTVGIFLAVFIAVFVNSLKSSAQSTESVENDSITVSLVTCYPGPDIYELCGHEAIRIRGNGIDSVWNFGTFDFSEPNFVYRFVKGETDYMLSSYPFEYFLPGYFMQNRRVVEQDLNLTQQEARKLHAMLQNEALPQNRKYRYNYVKDNCATRILTRLDQAVGEGIIYSDSVTYTSFRNSMRHYHKNYPWYQFGIDLALGSGIDGKINSRDEMFVPIDMMKKVSTAQFADGRPLVKETRIIYEGSDDAIMPPTSFWLSPLFIAALLLLICSIAVYYGYKRRVLVRWMYSLYFLILGFGGIIITFLVFVSQHEATSPNILILWINPLQLILAIGVWSWRMRYLDLIMSGYNIAVVGIMLLVWAFQKQSANPAFFPLMTATIILSVGYLIYYNQRRQQQIASPGTRRKSVKNNSTKRRK